MSTHSKIQKPNIYYLQQPLQMHLTNQHHVMQQAKNTLHRKNKKSPRLECTYLYAKVLMHEENVTHLER